MQTKEVLEQLKIGLSAKLGAEYKSRSSAAFRNVRHEKPFDGGSYVVSQNMAAYGDSFSLYLTLMVHHDEIEAVYGKALGLSSKDIAWRGSIFLNQAAFKGQSLHGFQVRTSQEVVQWVDLVADYIKEQGDVFWHRFGSLQSIDILVNTDVEDVLPWFADERFRAEYGLVAAKVNHNTNYKQLVQTYQAALANREDYPLFELVVDALDQA